MAAARIGSPQSRGTSPAGPLELDLARLEDVAHERPGACLELELGGGQGQVHRAKDAAPGRREAHDVAGRETTRDDADDGVT